MLTLLWRESGGPAVATQTSRGFGTVIIEKLIPQSLRGEAKMSWGEDGFIWTLHAPMSSIARAGNYTTGTPMT